MATMGTRNDDSEPAGAAAKGVQAVDRAIGVLELLARRGAVGVGDVAENLGVHKSTASRLLSALEARDLVEQRDARGRYRLSHGILRLASAVPARQDISHQAQPICDDLATKVGETVTVAVARSGLSVNLLQAFGPSTIGSQDWLGSLNPLHATSTGKVLLASLEPADLTAIVDDVPLERFTPTTVTDPAALRDQVAEAQRDGVAYAYEELEEGLNSLAAPIRDYTGAVIGAIGASGPVYRFTRERMHEVTPVVTAAAAEISRRMGYHPTGG